jgi:hypothetical protein
MTFRLTVEKQSALSFRFLYFRIHRIFPYYSSVIKYIDIFINFFLPSIHFHIIWFPFILLSFFLPYFLTSLHTFTCMSDYRRGFDWWLDLLITYAHNSLLQVIIAPSLISALYRSLEHTLSLLSLLSLVVSR